MRSDRKLPHQHLTQFRYGVIRSLVGKNADPSNEVRVRFSHYHLRLSKSKTAQQEYHCVSYHERSGLIKADIVAFSELNNFSDKFKINRNFMFKILASDLGGERDGRSARARLWG